MNLALPIFTSTDTASHAKEGPQAFSLMQATLLKLPDGEKWKKKVENSLWPQSKPIEMDLCRICEKCARFHGNNRGLVVVTWRGWCVTEFVGGNVVYLCLTQSHTCGCIHIEISARMDYCPARAQGASQFLRPLFVSPHTVFAREDIIVSSNCDFCTVATNCYFTFYISDLKTDPPQKNSYFISKHYHWKPRIKTLTSSNSNFLQKCLDKWLIDS